jgi:prepilin-type processing-associated H-X9-DG protein
MRIGLRLGGIALGWAVALSALGEDWQASSFQTRVTIGDAGKSALRARTAYSVEIFGVGGQDVRARFFEARSGKLVAQCSGKLTGYEKAGARVKSFSWAALGFGSSSSGVNVLMADGSVRFVVESIKFSGVQIQMLLPAVKKVRTAK